MKVVIDSFVCKKVTNSSKKRILNLLGLADYIKVYMLVIEGGKIRLHYTDGYIQYLDFDRIGNRVRHLV